MSEKLNDQAVINLNIYASKTSARSYEEKIKILDCLKVAKDKICFKGRENSNEASKIIDFPPES